MKQAGLANRVRGRSEEAHPTLATFWVHPEGLRVLGDGGPLGTGGVGAESVQDPCVAAIVVILARLLEEVAFDRGGTSDRDSLKTDSLKINQFKYQVVLRTYQYQCSTITGTHADGDVVLVVFTVSQADRR